MSDSGQDAIPSVEEAIEMVKGMRKELIQRINKHVSPGFRSSQDEVEEILLEAYPLVLEARKKTLMDGGCMWTVFYRSFLKYLLGSSIPGSSWDQRTDELPMLACPRANPADYVEKERYLIKTTQNIERILSPKEILCFRLFAGLTDHGALNRVETAKVMGVDRDYTHMILSRIERKIMRATKIRLEQEIIFVSAKQMKNFEKGKEYQKKLRIKERVQLSNPLIGKHRTN